MYQHLAVAPNGQDERVAGDLSLCLSETAIVGKILTHSDHDLSKSAGSGASAVWHSQANAWVHRFH